MKYVFNVAILVMIGIIVPNVFADDPYVSGNVVKSDNYPPWDRYIDVNGLRILGAPDIGGSAGVSDEFMEKIARTVQMILDPHAPGIDSALQKTAINGMGENYSSEEGFSQGLDSNQYGITLQRTFGDSVDQKIFYTVIQSIDENHIGSSSFADNPRWRDMVFQYYFVTNDKDSVNHQINEVLEHLLHTFTHYAFPVVYPVELNIQTPEGLLWESMQEAIRNGVFGISDYKEMDDGSNDYYALLMQEYTWWLILAEWDYVNKYYPDRSLSPEWADNSRTPSGVAANNPLGHSLYQNYLSKIIAKPCSNILDEMYVVDGTSGYIATHNGYEDVTPIDCTTENFKSFVKEEINSKPSEFEMTKIEKILDKIESSSGPIWLKDIVIWYEQQKISEGQLIKVIEYLIDEKILKMN